MKQVIKNYAFNAAARTITLSDFSGGQPVLLERLALITDTTTNKILYNFADSSLATAAVSSNNVITLSTLQGGEANTDKLRIDYDTVTGDTSYDSQTVSGTVGATQSGTWTVQPGNTANTTAWKVDASSVAVPVTDNGGSLTVDGTVTANAGSGTFNIQSNASVNLAQVAGGTAITSGVTGSQAIGGDTANGSSDAGNPVKIGGVGKTANPSAVTDGQRVNALFDKLGKQVVVPAIRDLVGDQVTTITSSTVATIIVTGVGSTFLDLTSLVLTNISATASEVQLLDDDGTTIRAVFHVPAGDTRGAVFTTPFKMVTAGNTWKLKTVTSIASLKVTAQFIKNT